MNTQTSPAFPVPVVRLIVTDPAGRVLILRRQNSSHGEGRWCLPGGKVDYGATMEDAVRAELKEETGLECLEARFLFYQDSLPPHPGQMHCINLYFQCRAAGSLVLNAESSDSAWIGPDQLARYDLVFRNDEGLERFWPSAAGIQASIAPRADGNGGPAEPGSFASPRV